MKPSKFHSNRGFHNWLLYDIGDKFLQKYSKFYKGVLVDLGCRGTSLRYLIESILVPFWILGQVVVPYLDKLDRNWEVETFGYFVLVRKK